MATHFWMFPWFALLAGLSCAALGALVAPRLPRSATKPAFLTANTVVWLIAVAVGVFSTLRLGATAGIDVIPARGILLGSVGMLAIIAATYRAPASWSATAPIVFGLTTAIVAFARLWLTHGEMNGLTSLAIGASLSVFCFALAPSLQNRGRKTDADNPPNVASAQVAIVAFVYLVSLAAGVEIGFTRADALDQTMWADLPLVVGGLLSIGALISAVFAGVDAAIASAIVAGAGAPLVLSLIVFPVLCLHVAHSWRLAVTTALGFVAFGLAGWLCDAEPNSAFRLNVGTIGFNFGMLIVAAAAILSFAMWSGYGLAFFALGGWLVLGSYLLHGKLEVASAGLVVLAFGSSLLVYRLALLSTGSAVRASGPGDIWDLFAIALGALVPVILVQWMQTDAASVRLPDPLMLGFWIVAVVLPGLVLDYTWRPRSLAGVFLGTALALLFSRRTREPLFDQAVVLVSLITALVLYEFLPALSEAASPTRNARIAIIAVLGAASLLRILLPVRQTSVNAQEA